MFCGSHASASWAFQVSLQRGVIKSRLAGNIGTTACANAFRKFFPRSLTILNVAV